MSIQEVVWSNWGMVAVYIGNVLEHYIRNVYGHTNCLKRMQWS